MARAQGARSQMAAAFEGTYGTSPASGYTKMPFASSTLSGEQKLQPSELLGYGRDPLAPVLDTLDADGAITVPIDAIGFGFWLKAAFGAPITTGTGPYTHEFRSGAWGLPSLSIEVGMPEVPSFSMFPGCKVNALSWDMARSGLLTATVDMIAQGEVLGTATGAGTPADIALDRFNHFHGSVERDGAALANVVSASIKYDNMLDRIETIRSDGRIDGLDESVAAMTGSITVRFASTALLAQATAGDPCELEFAYTLPGGESLTVTVHEVYLPLPKREINGPKGVQATFDWQAAKGAGAGRMATVVLVNDRAAY